VPRSDEGADAGDGAADDERVDLPGALVGVDRLSVGDEPAHLVLEQDAVAAEQLAGIAGGLSALRRGSAVATTASRLTWPAPGCLSG
jgi:hypothetical protein